MANHPHLSWYALEHQTVKSVEKRSWFRGCAGFTRSASPIIISFVALILIAGSLYDWAPTNTANLVPHDTVDLASNNPAASNFVNFTCHLAYGDLVLTITADINLTDWMNRDEAVLVANSLFDHTLGQTGQLHQLESSDMDELGVWTVELTWGYSTADLSHWFLAEIDPFNRTIVYWHCK